jgi:hypothetical protein
MKTLLKTLPAVISGVACSATLLLSGCAPQGDAAPAVSTDFGDTFPADHFLEFLNHANYTLVAATATAGQSDSFTLTVTYTDGSTQTFNGSWAGSAGKDPKNNSNPSFGVALNNGQGFTAKLSSSNADNYLYLLDVTGTVIAQDDNSGGGTNAQITLSAPAYYSASYTDAYYRALDPNYGGGSADIRSTFSGWLDANGFNDAAAAAAIHHVTMRDALDLGYGRDIHFMQHADCSVSVYVRNYQATGVPGQDYGPLNLDAAVNQIEKYHIGTNAIEWGPPISGDGRNTSPPVAAADPAQCASSSGNNLGQYVLRFYSFDPSDPQPRRNLIDMDSRGDKAMPIPCLTCHGGKADPLLGNGNLRLLDDEVGGAGSGGEPIFINRDNFGHLQPLRVDSFDFSTTTGYTRADLEPAFAAINQAIYDTYYWNQTPPMHYGFWDSTTARTIMANWYADPKATQAPDPTSLTDRFQLSTFQGDYVPSGWVPDPAAGSPPPNANTLYSDVIANNCRLCHLLRGNVYQSDIDFGAYDKFSNYSARIEDLVYDEGLMPLAQLTFDDFYSVNGRPEELASFIPGFSHYSSTGSVLLPGRPVADPGPSHTSPSPADLSASASILASQYEWTLTDQPPGSLASLSSSSLERTTLTTDTDGPYTVQLRVATSDGTWSDPVTTVISVDSAAKPLSQLSFNNDVKPILDTSCAAVCHKPHVPANGQPLPPVYYSDPDTASSDPNEANRDVYTDVMGRVNLSDPSVSLILEKPSGHSHGGNLVSGFDLNGDHSKYDVIQNWILGGARR